MGLSKVVRDEQGKERRIGNYIHVKNFRRNKRRKIIEAFGGKCCICGYERCLRSLSFHHVNPSEKLFGLSSQGLGFSFEKIEKEAEKCILVCSNCHGEIHDDEIVITLVEVV